MKNLPLFFILALMFLPMLTARDANQQRGLRRTVLLIVLAHLAIAALLGIFYPGPDASISDVLNM